MGSKHYYYSTRDLLIMAALAALGGLASTYINFIGDFFQSMLGFAGTTQWAAGLHVLWLILAVGLTRKQGAGTITGILKGAVELFSGNTHGLLVILVNVVAGVLVDLSLLPFRKKDHWLTYSVAGGLAAASNVIVFQLFAAVPADMLAFGIIGLIAVVAFSSGVLFAGVLGYGLLTTLRRSGVVKNQAPQPAEKNTAWIILLAGLITAAGIFSYLKFLTPGGEPLLISGTAGETFSFTPEQSSLEQQEAAVDRVGVAVSYRGYPLLSVLNESGAEMDFDFAVLHASDGYSFFITRAELEDNSSILIQPQGKGKNLVYNMVGPRSKKAWVNGVVEISLIDGEPLQLSVADRKANFYPGEWLEEMDSTGLDLGEGVQKYQGVALVVLFKEELLEGGYSEFVFESSSGEIEKLPAGRVEADSGIRVFVVLGQDRVRYAAAHLDGTVYLMDLIRVSLQ
jgi:energy-coupling factor transport system substrate-specific component